MSDEVKATGFGCCDPCDNDNDFLFWIIIIGVIFFLFGGFGRGFGRGY
ncbi:hypothetical protein [Sedimentibacter sp. MB31-C6]|nr:hypothetical protein [Sedimentibacter sp. MB36-C1]WSI04298.1 hypothetical protein U8307_00545 [Sedimentibacter sp. MB36-C1]